VLLTRIWGVLLAALATFCLAGMFLLARGSNEDFTEENRTALRAVTEAGVAALEAQIEASPVRNVALVRLFPDMAEALARTPTPEREAKLAQDKLPLAQVFTEAAEDMRVRNRSDMTLALIDNTGAIVAVSGIGEPSLAELVGSAAYQDLPSDQGGLFSLALGGQLQVVRVEPADPRGRRLIAFEPLQIGAGSLLRRVLGTDNPAAMVRNGKVLGDMIGDQPVSAEIEKFAGDHRDDAPDDGASKVFTIGEGMNARIGALGRVPGPAGKGKSAAMLVVLSRQTAAAGQRDLSEALSESMDKGTGSVNWVLLLGLLAVCAALSIYLPQIEALGPMRRLADEFLGVARGAQHQIFHDRYGGPTGEVARAANAAHEALRQAYLAELEIEEEVSEDSEAAGRRPKTVRGRRLTRSQRKIEESGSPLTPSETDAPRSGNTGPSRAANDAAEAEHATTGRRTPASRERVSMPPRGQTPAPGPLPTSARDVRTTGRGSVQPAPPMPPARSTGPAHTPLRTPAVPPPPTFQPPPPISADVPPQSQRPRTPVVVGPPPTHPPAASTSDADDPKAAYYREIFEEFLQVKIACGEPTAGFTFDKFVKKLQKNTQDILDKHSDVRDVQFTVYVKDGKAALKAKIVRQA
jgi:hypothetical protein